MALAADLPHVPEELRPALEEAVRRIVEIAQPELVILFGSYAEGGADEESDIDLLVVAETEDRIALCRRLHDAVRPALRWHGLDLVIVPQAEWREVRRLRGLIAWEADRFGVRLYGRAA